MNIGRDKLPREFYTRTDVAEVARDLLGTVLCTEIDGRFTAGVIVETEAYSGRNDKACHANGGRRTDRTEIMYHRGGVAYIYLCYGIHHLFNVVTNRRDAADAVLVRAVRPLEGIDTMLRRRNMQEARPRLTAGPGRLTEALGITTDLYGTDLLGDTVWIETPPEEIPANRIGAGPRIGVEYAGSHAERPWRFVIKDTRWVSNG